MHVERHYIALLLLLVFLGITAERLIPHTHIEAGGVLLPDFSGEHHDEGDEQDGEGLHASHFVWQSFSFDCNASEISVLCCEVKSYPELPDEPLQKDFNILPKVLSTLLGIIHHYSSKAPPLSI